MWADGFAAYLQGYEVRLHRRLDSFGGRVWPDSRPGLIGPDRQLEIALAATERRAS